MRYAWLVQNDTPTFNRCVTTGTQLAAVVAFSVAMHAGAQDYPTKPVRIIAPSPGTSADLLARVIGPKLAEQWNNSVIVDNRSGGPSAMRPAIMVAKATPDGYTLLMGETSSLATAVSLFKKLEYDPALDFAPITLVARAPLVLVVHASMPVSNLREFIAHAKKNPDALSYASAATGSISHLTTALLLQLTGMKAVHVPYKGAGAATLAVVAGEVPFASIALSSAMPQLNTAKVRALAVASKHRVKRDPIADVPTAAEAGLSGFESEAWFGLLAPARTPAALVSRLNRNVVSVLREPAMQQEFVKRGAEPQPSTPDEFARFIQAETDKWRRVINAAGISLQ
jgi:tripartite-type tricarboxylate transporter receptor subunit TctC